MTQEVEEKRLCTLISPSIFSPVSQYFADAAEAVSWLDDRRPLLTSEDLGKDESSTAALLQRHQRLEKEMATYGSEMRRLSEQARSAAQLTALTVSLVPNLWPVEINKDGRHVSTVAA